MVNPIQEYKASIDNLLKINLAHGWRGSVVTVEDCSRSWIGRIYASMRTGIFLFGQNPKKLLESSKIFIQELQHVISIQKEMGPAVTHQAALDVLEKMVDQHCLTPPSLADHLVRIDDTVHSPDEPIIQQRMRILQGREHTQSASADLCDLEEVFPKGILDHHLSIVNNRRPISELFAYAVVGPAPVKETSKTFVTVRSTYFGKQNQLEIPVKHVRPTWTADYYVQSSPEEDEILIFACRLPKETSISYLPSGIQDEGVYELTDGDGNNQLFFVPEGECTYHVGHQTKSDEMGKGFLFSSFYESERCVKSRFSHSPLVSSLSLAQIGGNAKSTDELNNRNYTLSKYIDLPVLSLEKGSQQEIMTNIVKTQTRMMIEAIDNSLPIEDQCAVLATITDNKLIATRLGEAQIYIIRGDNILQCWSTPKSGGKIPLGSVVKNLMPGDVVLEVTRTLPVEMTPQHLLTHWQSSAGAGDGADYGRVFVRQLEYEIATLTHDEKMAYLQNRHLKRPHDVGLAVAITV